MDKYMKNSVRMLYKVILSGHPHYRYTFTQGPHEHTPGLHTFSIEGGELKYTDPMNISSFVQPDSFVRVRTI